MNYRVRRFPHISEGRMTMGNCLISVHVTGSHHNGIENDVDQMAAKFVDELAKKHNVTNAKLVTGGENDLLQVETRFPLREQKPGFYTRT